MILTGTFSIFGTPGTTIDMIAEAYSNAGLSAPDEYPGQDWHLQKGDNLSVSLKGDTGTTSYPLPTASGSLSHFTFSQGDKPSLVNNASSEASVYYVLATS